MNFTILIGFKIHRVPTASYKSYNWARCPIFVLYLGEEGICPILFLKMSYKSYNVMSYNWAKMSYISSKNCPIILYIFREKSVGTLNPSK